MRIVIDMQGAQTESRFRGIGRYTLSLALAIARNRGKHEIVLALNGLFADTIESIRAAFDGLLPQENIRVWTAPGPIREVESANHKRREVAERIREVFLASLNPDVVLISSLFEGLGDDAVTSVGVMDHNTPTAVILYDLIPLINPDINFRSNKVYQEYYARKIASLERSQRVLAISDSARQEAVIGLGFPSQHVVNISGACDTTFRLLSLTKEEKKYLFRKYNILKPFVMYTGGADERKNLHRLIEAYSRLPESVRRRYQLVFVGRMPNENVRDLTESARKHGLSSDDIVVTGYVEDGDLVKLYNSCTLFVFPSVHEGFGIPPLEAMLCGAPVIAADATSLPEVIGCSDALFDPLSVTSISNKLKQALTDEAFRTSLIAHGKTHARTFSWDESAKRAIDVLQALAPTQVAKSELTPQVARTSIFKKRQQRILLIKLDHMGDLFLSIPAITKIRAKYPYASIDIIVGSWNVGVATSLNIFDNIYTLDFFKRKSSEPPEAVNLEIDKILGKLPDYDTAIDLRRQSDTRFLLVKTKAKIKVGYDTYDPAINAQLDIGLRTYPDVPFEKTLLNSTFITKQMLALVDALPADVNDFVSFPDMGKRAVSDRTSIAIFPLAGNDIKEWGKSNYSALVELLRHDSRIDCINVYFSNSGESKGFDFSADDKLRLHFGLDFQALTRSVSENVICLANNSFGAHFGSYLGLTVVAIYGGHETPDEWAPVFGDSYVIHTAASCSPCHLAQRSDCPYDMTCLNDITVDFVFEKVLEAVNSIKRSHGRIDEPAKQTISLREGRRDVVNDLIASITDGSHESRTWEEYAEIATALSRNHPRNGQSRQLLVDISELVAVDAKSGIQRVVRSILTELLGTPPKGYKVEPVYAIPGQPGYRYARTFISRFSGNDGSGSDDLVDAYNGDVFLGLDLQFSIVAAQKPQLHDWHRNGVKIFFVVYDLLPILFPRGFPDGAQAAHHGWLENISCFDGAICISRTVADEFHDWLQAFGPKRDRPFLVNWFHLGADIENTMPTKGMPDNANEVLGALNARPSFLMVSTLEPRKGHAQVLAAFEQLWSEGVDANLVIVGKNGWMVEPLIKKLRGHNKQGKRLFWLDGISDEFLQSIYASSTCLIVASEGEGFGLPLIEAAQHKLPIVARDLPVFREVAGDHASYFSNDNAPEVVANVVREWLVLNRVGKNPNSDSMRWLTWKESTKQLLDAMLGDEPYQVWLPDGGLHYWGNDPRLHTQVGQRVGKSVSTTAQGGCLLHGPYISLPAGHYRLAWHGSASQWTGQEWVDVAVDQGRECVWRADLRNQNTGRWRYDAELIFDAAATDVEFRLYVDEQSNLKVDGVEIALVGESDASASVDEPSTVIPGASARRPVRASAQPDAAIVLSSK